MTIDELLTPEDCDTLQLEYTQMTDEAQASITSLEDVLNGLSEIEAQVVGEGTICRTQAASLESMIPGILPRYASVQSFTARPSVTNLKVALEEIDKKKAGIIAAIVVAAGAFLYKLWKWISGKSDDAKTTMGAAAAGAEKVNKAEEQYTAAMDELKHNEIKVEELERQVKQDTQVNDKLQIVSEHYTEIVHLMFTNATFPESLSKLLGTASNAHNVLKQAELALNELVAAWKKDVMDATLQDPGTDLKTDEGMDKARENYRDRHSNFTATKATAFGNAILYGIDSIDTLRKGLGHLIPSAQKLAEINPVGDVVSDNPDDVLVAHIEHAKGVKQWFTDYIHALGAKAEGAHYVKGYKEVHHVLSQSLSFSGKCSALGNTLSKVQSLGDIAEMYSPEKVNSRIKDFGDGVKSTLIRHAENLIVVYAQIIAQIVHLATLVANNCRRFIESSMSYQKTRKKSLTEKAKEAIHKAFGSDYPERTAKANAIIEKLAEDIV